MEFLTSFSNYKNLILDESLYILIAVTGLSVLAFLIARAYLVRIIHTIIANRNPTWRPILSEKATFQQLIYMVPALVFYFWIQYFPETSAYVNRILNFYIIINLLLLIGSLLTTGQEIYRLYPISRKKPIKSYVQLLTMFIYIVGGIVSICVLLDKSPWAFLSSIGALTALILLVFRDTILSFIAGIQLIANNLIEKDDWIEVPQFGADGAVLDVALHVVKVQNWDKTIVTIPTYKLIESGFKNWRGMYDAGGRRIKRSLQIDQTSVRFLKPEEIRHLFTFPLIKKTLGNYDIENTEATNLGLFRRYVEQYLKIHPKIRSDLTFIVRLLDPAPTGIPLEIYVFSGDTAWANYETIQAEIFEHFLAILQQFDLRIFQNLNGHDFLLLQKKLSQKPGFTLIEEKNKKQLTNNS